MYTGFPLYSISSESNHSVENNRADSPRTQVPIPNHKDLTNLDDCNGLSSRLVTRIDVNSQANTISDAIDEDDDLFGDESKSDTLSMFKTTEKTSEIERQILSQKKLVEEQDIGDSVYEESIEISAREEGLSTQAEGLSTRAQGAEKFEARKAQVDEFVDFVEAKYHMISRDKGIKANNGGLFKQRLTDEVSEHLTKGTGVILEEKFRKKFDKVLTQHWKEGYLTDILTGRPISRERFEAFKAELEEAVVQQLLIQPWFISRTTNNHESKSEESTKPLKNVYVFEILRPYLPAEMEARFKKEGRVPEGSLTLIKAILMANLA